MQRRLVETGTRCFAMRESTVRSCVNSSKIFNIDRVYARQTPPIPPLEYPECDGVKRRRCVRTGKADACGVAVLAITRRMGRGPSPMGTHLFTLFNLLSHCLVGNLDWSDQHYHDLLRDYGTSSPFASHQHPDTSIAQSDYDFGKV